MAEQNSGAKKPRSARLSSQEFHEAFLALRFI